MNNSPLTLVALLSLGLGTTLSAGPGPRQFAPELTSQVDEIRAGLQRKGATYEVDVNPAMQYSLDQICGLKPELRPYDFQAHAEGGYLNDQTEDLTAVTLPAKFVGWFSSVKDQGQCGSCWAFATIGTLEGAALKKRGYPQGRVNADGSITTSGDITVLSEQQVLSCNPEGYGCQGGWYAFDMLMPANATQGQGYYKGAIPARVFPYVAKEVACSFNTSTSYTPVSSWGYVGNGYSTPLHRLDQGGHLPLRRGHRRGLRRPELPGLPPRRLQRQQQLLAAQPRHPAGGLGRQQGRLAAEELLERPVGHQRLHVDQVRRQPRGRLPGLGAELASIRNRRCAGEAPLLPCPLCSLTVFDVSRASGACGRGRSPPPG